MKIIKNLFLFTVVFICPSLKAQLTFIINNLSSSYSITCGQPTVNLAAISNYSSSVSYTWTSPQLVSTTANSLGITNPGTYTISATAGSLSASQTLAIGINTTAPSLTITTTSSILTCAVPTTSVLGLCNASSFGYMWYLPTIQQDLIIENPKVAGISGTYTFIAQDNTNGCTSTATIYIGDNRTYFPMTNPHPFLVPCPDGTVSINPIISATSNTSNMVFSWASPATATISYISPATLVTNAPGNYTVVATNTLNGCFTKALISVYACVGLAEYSEIAFKIVPNPVKDKLHFEFDGPLNENLKLDINNTLGQLVYSKENFDLKEELDLSVLTSGIYYLKVENENSYKVVKIMKE